MAKRHYSIETDFTVQEKRIDVQAEITWESNEGLFVDSLTVFDEDGADIEDGQLLNQARQVALDEVRVIRNLELKEF